jgi:hypothetical protein
MTEYTPEALSVISPSAARASMAATATSSVSEARKARSIGR